MNLQQLYDTLESTKSSLKFEIINNGAHYNVSNWSTLCDTLYLLYDIHIFRKTIGKIFDLGASFRVKDNSLTINASQREHFIKYMAILQGQVDTAIGLTSTSLIGNKNENQIHIKLPNISDLTELSSIIDKLDKVFTQCPIFDEQLKVEFDGVQSGSSWIIITVICIVGGVTTLKPIAEFIKVCFECVKLFKENQKIDLEKVLLRSQIDDAEKNKLIEIANNIFIEDRKSICLEKVNHINPAKIESLNPEEISRLVYSISNLSELFEKGLEIYPSKLAENETKEILPFKEPESRLHVIEKDIPLINGSNSK